MRRMWLSVQTQKQATYSTLWVLRDVAYQSVYKRGQVLTKHLSCDALESILLPESLNGLSTTGYPVTVTQSPRGTTWNPVSFVTSITNSTWDEEPFFLSFFLRTILGWSQISRTISKLSQPLWTWPRWGLFEPDDPTPKITLFWGHFWGVVQIWLQQRCSAMDLNKAVPPWQRSS